MYRIYYLALWLQVRPGATATADVTVLVATVAGAPTEQDA